MRWLWNRLLIVIPSLRLPILIDMQTHVWWRAGGIAKMSERGEAFLKSLAGARSNIVGKPVAVADMGRIMFIEDLFLRSETDLAFLNSFGMKAAFDGVDLFPAARSSIDSLDGAGAHSYPWLR